MIVPSDQENSRGSNSVQEHGTRYHVLLVEDNPINQIVAVRLLEKRGYTVTLADNGHAAVTRVAREAFDFVLMDVHMPGLDGLEATSAIRESEKTTGGHIPIIAMTAQALKGSRERCLEAGMDGYLSKPISLIDLFKVIDQIGIASKRYPEQALTEHPLQEVFDAECALAMVDGNVKMLLELVGLFSKQYPKQIAAICEAIERSDIPGMEKAVHSLKCSICGFGARAAFDAVMKLEILSKEGDMSGAAEACLALDIEIERLQEALGRLARNGLVSALTA